MIQIKKSTVYFLLQTLFVASVTLFGFNFAQAAGWTPPTQSFPNENASSPIHVGTGIQVKGSSGSQSDGIASDHLIAGKGGWFGNKIIADKELCFGNSGGLVPYLQYINGSSPTGWDCIDSWSDIAGSNATLPDGALNHTLRYDGTTWIDSGLLQNDGTTVSVMRGLVGQIPDGGGTVGLGEGFQLVKKAFAQMTQNSTADIFKAYFDNGSTQSGLRVDSTGRTVLTGDLISFSPSYFFKDVTLGAESGVFANLPINLKVFGNSQFGSETVPREVRVKGGVFVSNLEHNNVLYPNEAPVCATTGGRLVLCPPPAPINVMGQAYLPYWMYDDQNDGGTWFPYNISNLDFSGNYSSGIAGTVMAPASYYSGGNFINPHPTTCQQAFSWGMNASGLGGGTTSLPYPTGVTVPLTDIRATVSVDGGAPTSVVGKCYYITGVITTTTTSGGFTVTFNAPKIELLPATTQGYAIGSASLNAGNFTGTLSSGYTQGANHAYQWKSEIQIHP